MLPATVKRGYRHGTDRLVNAIVKMGAVVSHTHPGFTLGVGNLSQEGGGDIPQSRSHNSGRDADLAFPLRDSDGRPVAPGALVRLGLENTSLDGTKRHLAADVAWTLVEGLLALPDIDVAWIFCSHSVRAAILEAAVAAEAPPEDRVRASVVLRQPSDSSPHDDHFHIRIYCSPVELAEHACVDRAIHWPWIAHGTPLHVPMRKPGDTAHPLREIGLGEVLEASWDDQINGLIALLRTDPQHASLVLGRLRSLTGSALPTAGLSPRRVHRRWAQWWTDNRARYGLSKSPE